MKFSLTHLIICMILASSFQMMKSSKIKNRILNDEEEVQENDVPDLDMLEELEDELDDNGGNIFDELVNEKQEMIDRLEMLQCMVEDQLATRDHLNNEDNTNKDKGKFFK